MNINFDEIFKSNEKTIETLENKIKETEKDINNYSNIIDEKDNKISFLNDKINNIKIKNETIVENRLIE